MAYTTLFFDLDNTLLDSSKSEATAVSRVLKQHGLPFGPDTVALYSRVNQSYWERFEKGEIPKTDIFEGRFKTLLSLLKTEGDSAAISADYCANLALGHDLMNGSLEILAYLTEKGYAVYATTNGFAFTQHNRIKDSGLEPFFKKIFISEETGFQKPDKAYFDYVVAHIEEQNRANMLVIGDSQSSDILGGINAGIDTCWLNRNGSQAKYESRYEISALSELRQIL